MTGFVLLENYVENLEEHLRKNRTHTTFPSTTPPSNKPVTLAPSTTPSMAKSLRDYSVPVVAMCTLGPLSTRAWETLFELHTGLIMMVQANQFCGLPNEVTSAHLQHFLELCDTIVIKDVAPASIRLHLFPFFLVGKAK